MICRTIIPNWSQECELVPNKLVNRVLANLEPVVQIDSVIYIKYIGPEDKKALVFEAFKKCQLELNQFAAKFNAKIIKAEKIDNIKLKWLEGLIEKYQPNKVEFSIK